MNGHRPVPGGQNTGFRYEDFRRPAEPESAACPLYPDQKCYGALMISGVSLEVAKEECLTQMGCQAQLKATPDIDPFEGREL